MSTCICVKNRHPDCPEHGWDAAPVGSMLVSDLRTGEQHVEPPPDPVTIEEFLRK